MMTPDAERHVDPLGRYWNEVVAGEPAAPSDLDPDLAATVRRLQSLGSAPTPDPTFAAHLLEDLMGTARLHALAGLSPFPSPASVPRTRTKAPESRSLPRRWFGRGRWMPRLELAAAALLVFVLAASLLALDGDVRHRVGSIVTQDDEDEPGLERIDLKGIYTVPAGDQGTVEVTLRRVTIAPGVTWTSPRAFSMTQVKSGSLVGDLPEGAIGGEPMQEGSGLSGEGELTLRNEGTEPAVLLQVAIGQGVRSPTLPPGVTIEEFGGGEVGTLPAGNALVTLSFPDWEVGDGSDYDAGKEGLALVAIESGTLAIAGDAGDVVLNLDTAKPTPSATRDPRRGPPSELRMTAGESALLRGGAFLNMYNPGPDHLLAMVLTINPGSAEADITGESIASSVYGTPAPGESQGEPPSMPTPSVDSRVVTPEECDGEALSPEAIRALDESDLHPTQIAGVIEPPFEDQLPQGPPADADTIAAIAAVEREYRACLTAGDFPRLFALLTDDRARQILATFPEEDKQALLDGTWTAQPDSYRMALFPPRDVRVLPDGRVAAIVQYGPPNSPRQVDGYHFQIYELVDGRWLVDELTPFIPYP